MPRLALTVPHTLLACTPIPGAVSIAPEEITQASEWAAAKFKGVVATEAPASGLVALANHDPVQLNSRAGKPRRIVDREYTRSLRRGASCARTGNLAQDARLSGIAPR